MFCMISILVAVVDLTSGSDRSRKGNKYLWHSPLWS